MTKYQGLIQQGIGYTFSDLYDTFDEASQWTREQRYAFDEGHFVRTYLVDETTGEITATLGIKGV